MVWKESGLSDLSFSVGETGGSEGSISTGEGGVDTLLYLYDCEIDSSEVTDISIVLSSDMTTENNFASLILVDETLFQNSSFSLIDINIASTSGITTDGSNARGIQFVDTNFHFVDIEAVTVVLSCPFSSVNAAHGLHFARMDVTESLFSNISIVITSAFASDNVRVLNFYDVSFSSVTFEYLAVDSLAFTTESTSTSSFGIRFNRVFGTDLVFRQVQLHIGGKFTSDNVHGLHVASSSFSELELLDFDLVIDGILTGRLGATAIEIEGSHNEFLNITDSEFINVTLFVSSSLESEDEASAINLNEIAFENCLFERVSLLVVGATITSFEGANGIKFSNIQGERGLF